MKKMLFFLTFVLAINYSGIGQTLLVDDFTGYTVGILAGQGSWTKGTATGIDPTVANTTPLTYTNYNGGGAEYVAIPANTSTSTRVFKLFTPVTSYNFTTFYFSFLLRVTTPVANSVGYFMSLGNAAGATSSLGGKLFIKANGTGFSIGISKNTTTITNITYGTSVYNLGQTYLVVVKYVFNVPGTTPPASLDDQAYLWVNPVISSEPPTSSAECAINGGATTDVDFDGYGAIAGGVGSFMWHNRGITNPVADFDAVRVSNGTTSADAWTNLNAYSGGSTPTMTLAPAGLTGFTYIQGSGPSAEQSFIISGANLTSNISIVPPTDYEISTSTGVSFSATNPISLVPASGTVNSTTIYVRLKAGLGSNAYNGELITASTAGASNSTVTCDGSVTVAIVPPTIGAPTSATIINTSAVLGGTITADGGTPITARGTVWNTTTGVTIGDNYLVEGGTTIATFSHIRAPLPPKTQIFFKAFATNSAGTNLTSEASFYTLANEPTSHVAGFAAVSGGTTSINLTWTTAASGADGYLILQKTGAIAPTGIPVDATGYTVGSVLGDGTVAALVNPGSTLAKTITGLSPATQYSFSIIPYGWDGANNATYNYFPLLPIPSASATTTGSGPVTYTWQGADNGLWTLATNWNPSRTSPATSDILQFTDGTLKTVTVVVTETIGKLIMANNTSINLQSNAAAIITISGVAGVDLDIPTGCALNLNAINAITIAIATTATGSISGNMTFSSTVATVHRLTAADPGGITFNNGAVFTAGTFFSGNAFGNGIANSVIFASGSTYVHQAGSNPFVNNPPTSITVFQAGSLYKLISASTPSFSGKTYANFEMDVTGATVTTTGGSPVSMDNLTITNGTLNFNMTGPTTGIHQIHGNILVATGGILNFSPASAGTVNLNGTSAQSISGPGPITTGTNSILEISNSNGINLNTPATVNGQLKLTSGLLTLGSNNLVLGTAATITGTPSSTAMIVATGTGQLQKGFAVGFTGSFVYPVGDNTLITEYSPVTLNFSSGTFATGNYAGVNLVNAKYPTDPNMGSYLNRYWNVTSSGITAFTCSALCQYVPADVVGNELQMFSMNVGAVPYTNFGLVDNALHQVNATGQTAFGTYTGSQPAPSVITIPANAITATTATLNGEIIANWNTTAVSFEYGLTNGYGTSVPGTPVSVTGGGTNTVLANITGLTLNTVYHFRVNGTNSSGTSNGADLSFSTGCPIPSGAGTITGPVNVCLGGTGYVFTVPVISYATTYNWIVPTGAVISAGTSTNSITVSFPAGSISGNVSVSGSSICGSGTSSLPLAVTVNPLPVPVITGSANACINSTGNVYTTQPGMTNYAWTVSAGGTIVGGSLTNSISVTWTTAGAKTVTANYTNGVGCTAVPPSSFAVTVIAFPTPTIAGPAVVCANAANIVYTTEAGMTNYNWTVSIGGTIVSGAGTNAITVLWPYAGNRSVSVAYTNPTGCSALAPTIYNVTINPAAVPTIGSSNNPCLNSTNNQYITNSGMANYIWAISAGGTIVSGQGTSTINVSWTSIGAQWVSASFTNTFGCTPPTPTVYNLFVNPLPNAAGIVTGTSAVCAATNGVAYSCAEIPNATSYNWILPAGAVIATGAGTKNITVNYGANAVSGNITVSGTNGCGNGPVSPTFTVTINPLPATGGNINGSASVCAGSTGFYIADPISFATSYVWSVPAGATFLQAYNTITVTFGNTTGSGVITVKGINTCGSGAVSPNFNVAMNAIPPAPVVTVSGNVLTSSATAGNQWYYGNSAIAGATGQTYTVINNTGFYWCMVTINGCPSPISNKVWVVVTGQEELQNNNFSVYPVPNDGQFTVSIVSPVQETYTIIIYNQIGAKIHELKDVQVNGTFEKQIDLRPVANGIYSVVFLNSDRKVVRKVLVKK